MTKLKEYQIINGIKLKYCNDCKQWKPLEAFSKNERASDKLNYICRICNSNRGKKWSKENPEKSNAKAKNSRANNLANYQERDRKYYNNRYAIDPDYRNKKIIRAKTLSAIESGRLARRKNCEICRIDGPLEIHHEAYDEAHILDVVFLCEECHRMIHDD